MAHRKRLGDTSEDNLFFINCVREVLGKEPIGLCWRQGQAYKEQKSRASRAAWAKRNAASDKMLPEAAE